MRRRDTPSTKAIDGFGRDDIARLLADARDRGANEVHFKVPGRPLFRIDGDLIQTHHARVRPQSAHQIANSLCAIAGIEVPLAQITEYEFSFGLMGVGRFRVVLYRQRGTIAIIVQRSALDIPELGELGVEDAQIAPLLGTPGLLLVGGGSRRRAMVAAMVERFNIKRQGYVVTVEDPITFLHSDAMAIIAQRGVGSDVKSKAEGVIAGMRHGANLIAIHEVDSCETAQAMLTAAEHGCSVIACASSSGTADVIQRISWLYPPADRDTIARRLRDVTTATVALPESGDTVLTLGAGASD